MNKKGMALIITFAVILLLTILGSAIISRSISENNIARRYSETAQAFWLSEAGINRALYELRNDYNSSSISATQLGSGGYEATISSSGGDRIVNSTGYFPFSGAQRASRSIEATMSKSIPPNFYDNAIYSAGEVDLNGNSYSITGDIRYADEIDNTGNVNGTITQDNSINPLARFDFQQLRALSSGQQNVYVISGNNLVNEATGEQGFPGSFWYSPPTDPDDPATGTPNIVYIEGDLQLNGNIGTIGGFFVVAGDVINNLGATYDADVNGRGQIDGAIYTRGEFRINGGGGNLNINGGVWAGEEARLNGNAHVAYNNTYMSALGSLNLTADVQISSWKDTQNSYQLTP
ncbi:MAG: hypothetical protein A3J51_01455 [Omnitrophica WOR_2 bacterium RIFCSPHIGHO2_02_FULL_45_21]|nr:MAG: hypothetical protein A3J51_01455 [Omnitrophica WOR_2 bacterium RIFCSPHIGHO2_02_FULL_45_21]